MIPSNLQALLLSSASGITISVSEPAYRQAGLDGRTPDEVWRGADIFTKTLKQEYWVEAWTGC